MLKNFLFVAVVVLSACNSGPKTSSNDDKTSTNAKSYNWSENDEKEFLSGCVDSARLKLGDAAAYAQCKCILGQLKQAYPNMDSAAPALMDVKKVAAMAAKCK